MPKLNAAQRRRYARSRISAGQAQLQAMRNVRRWGLTNQSRDWISLVNIEADRIRRAGTVSLGRLDPRNLDSRTRAMFPGMRPSRSNALRGPPRELVFGTWPDPPWAFPANRPMDQPIVRWPITLTASVQPLHRSSLGDGLYNRGGQEIAGVGAKPLHIKYDVDLPSGSSFRAITVRVVIVQALSPRSSTTEPTWDDVFGAAAPGGSQNRMLQTQLLDTARTFRILYSQVLVMTETTPKTSRAAFLPCGPIRYDDTDRSADPSIDTSIDTKFGSLYLMSVSDEEAAPLDDNSPTLSLQGTFFNKTVSTR